MAGYNKEKKNKNRAKHDKGEQTIKKLQLEEKIINDPKDIATALNNYFVDSVKDLAWDSNPQVPLLLPMPLNTAAPVFNLCTLSQSQVDKVICGLNSSKAKDAFGMDVLFLKNQKDSLIAPLTSIINTSISEEIFPDPWKHSIITPIFKSGNPAITSNYRPISILPTVSKIMEKLVAEQIINHLNNSPFILNQMQFGFRNRNGYLLPPGKHKIKAGCGWRYWCRLY